VPGKKNMINTHLLYKVGRKVQIVGNLVDWDTKLDMAVVLVSYHEAPEHPDTDYINR
jgi:hypothetical protein